MTSPPTFPAPTRRLRLMNLGRFARLEFLREFPTRPVLARARRGRPERCEGEPTHMLFNLHNRSVVMESHHLSRSQHMHRVLLLCKRSCVTTQLNRHSPGKTRAASRSDAEYRDHASPRLFRTRLNRCRAIALGGHQRFVDLPVRMTMSIPCNNTAQSAEQRKNQCKLAIVIND